MTEYGEAPQVAYENGDYGLAVFVRVCPICGRFVTADDSIMIAVFGQWVPMDNATCSMHGRVRMPFEGFFDPEEG